MDELFEGTEDTVDTEGLISGIVDTLMDEEYGLSFIEMFGILEVAKTMIHAVMTDDGEEIDDEDEEDEDEDEDALMVAQVAACGTIRTAI